MLNAVIVHGPILLYFFLLNVNEKTRKYYFEPFHDNPTQDSMGRRRAISSLIELLITYKQ